MPRDFFFFASHQAHEILQNKFHMFFFPPISLGGKKKMQNFKTFIRLVIQGNVLLHGCYHCRAINKAIAIEHLQWRVSAHFRVSPKSVTVWVLNGPLVPMVKKYNNAESYRWA